MRETTPGSAPSSGKNALFNSYTNAYFKLDAKLNEAKVEQLLNEYGWRHRERDFEDRLADWPFEINHKHVKVSYRGI